MSTIHVETSNASGLEKFVTVVLIALNLKTALNGLEIRLADCRRLLYMVI
jgi:hypothetical protein